MNKNVKGNKMSVDSTAIHPYVGITRIRLEGIISAHNMWAPLDNRLQR